MRQNYEHCSCNYVTYSTYISLGRITALLFNEPDRLKVAALLLTQLHFFSYLNTCKAQVLF